MTGSTDSHVVFASLVSFDHDAGVTEHADSKASTRKGIFFILFCSYLVEVGQDCPIMKGFSPPTQPHLASKRRLTSARVFIRFFFHCEKEQGNPSGNSPA
jgi:hypothetical protein